MMIMDVEWQRCKVDDWEQVGPGVAPAVDGVS